MTEQETKLREALLNLYDHVEEDNSFRGWKRGQNALRQAEIALGYLPRTSPYGDVFDPEKV